MELPDQVKSKSTDGLEEWCLRAMETDPLPVEHLLGVLTQLARRGAADRAEEWGALLQEALIKRNDRPNSLRLLMLRLDWRGDRTPSKTLCRETIERVFADRVGKIFATSVGLDQDTVRPAECLRRLETLLTLAPGMFCHDKTWGFGVVKQVDDFYKRVTIDFSGKPNHQMSFAYAAETLAPVSDDHLLARKHRDRAALEALVEHDPAEVVRIALRSYGPQSAPLLKEKLVPEVFAEADWKPFWEAARKTLKNDPFVEIPTKRNDPIRLLARQKTYDDEWFARLVGERDMPTLLTRIGEALQADATALQREAAQQVVIDRIKFVIRGTEGKDPAMLARAVMLARRCGLPTSAIDARAVLAELLEPGTLIAAASGLPVRDLSPLLQLLAEHDPTWLGDLLIKCLPAMPLPVLTAALEHLDSTWRGDEAMVVLRDLMVSRVASVHVLYWASRHLDRLPAWRPVALIDILLQVVDQLDLPLSGEELKTQNQMKILAEEKRAWLEQVLAGLDGLQRGRLLGRINACRGWDPSSRRSVLARMIRLYPELERALDSGEPKEAVKLARFTSLRTHREKRLQLQRLIEVDIPENSREIGVARSYGDLRENAEYKFAREHQAVLMRRKAELEHDLAEVMATDFAGFPSEVVGMGTSVTLALADGRTELYHILGEWDRDESMRIIACRSKLAEALVGRPVGADVTIPDALHGTVGRIVAVQPLPDDVKAWMMQSPVS